MKLPTFMSRVINRLVTVPRTSFESPLEITCMSGESVHESNADMSEKSGKVVDVAVKQTSTKKTDSVTMRFPFIDEDAKYIRVRVKGRKFSVAKSRVQYKLEGDKVVVSMTSRYAAGRPELMEQE